MLWPTQCLRATGDRLRPGVLTLRQAQEEPFTGVIDQILVDELRRPRKQRHTAQRIFQRLRDEHGFGGQYTIVKDYVREHRRGSQEMFVPLSHPPGHAQCDFGEALVIIGGVEQKAHCFVLDLPHSDGCFVKAYPAETTEAFLDGHVSAFAFLGGVPQSILYDNTKLAVARILGDGRRKRTRPSRNSSPTTYSMTGSRSLFRWPMGPWESPGPGQRGHSPLPAERTGPAFSSWMMILKL